jgi:hypothetical protein
MIWLEEKKAYDLLTDFDGFHGLFSNCLSCQKITIIFLKYIYIYMIATVIIHTMVAQSTSFYEHSQRDIIAALIKTKNLLHCLQE